MLQESGISKQDQAANPQAVIDIIGFYTDSQEGKQNDAVWQKFGHNPAEGKPGKPSPSSTVSSVSSQKSQIPKEEREKPSPPPTAPRQQVFENPVRLNLRFFFWLRPYIFQG